MLKRYQSARNTDQSTTIAIMIRLLAYSLIYFFPLLHFLIGFGLSLNTQQLGKLYRQNIWVERRVVNPISIGVKYSLIVFTPCLCFDLLIGQQLIFFYFELKL